MSKKLTILCTLAFLVAFTLPAYAAVEHIRVGGDITVYGLHQADLDLKDTGDEDTFFATITRVKVEADLTDDVYATVRLLNERRWDAEADAQTDIYLDLAYITLADFLYSPMTLKIGRQDLRYGNALIIGDPDTNVAVRAGDLDNTTAEFLSARKSFDAIRAIWDYNPWIIDAVAIRIDEGFKAAGDVNVYGVNLAYDGFVNYEAEAEGYWFIKDDDGTPEKINVIGLRGGFVPGEGLTLDGEIAHQFGDTADLGVERDAWALDLAGTYALGDIHETVLRLAYSYRSGDDAATGDDQAWDPMYEDQTRGMIADYLFGKQGVSSNARIINLGASIKPMVGVTLGIDWFIYRLDEEIAGIGAIDGNVGVGPIGPNHITYDLLVDDDFGDEVNLSLVYDYTEDVQFGLIAGWFWPGDAFDVANNDTATQILSSVRVAF